MDVARPKTYFEQVPLVLVKRILKERAAQRKSGREVTEGHQQWAKKN